MNTWESYQQIAVYPLKRYYGAGILSSVALNTGSAGAVDTLYTAPMLLPRKTLIESIAFNVTAGAAGSSARIGIYNCRDGANGRKGDLYPYRNLFDSGSIATTGSGMMEAYCRRWLKPGLYWLAMNFGVDVATIRTFGVAARACVLGFDSTIASPGYGWTVASTYGPFPGAFPAGATVLTTTPVLGMFYRPIAFR